MDGLAAPARRLRRSEPFPQVRRARNRRQFRPLALSGSNDWKKARASLRQFSLNDSEQISLVPGGCTLLLRAAFEQWSRRTGAFRLFL